MTRHFTLNANYTVSRAMAGNPVRKPVVVQAFATIRTTPELWDARLRTDSNDERHHVTVSGMVELPWGFDFAPILQFGTARPTI